MNLRPFVRLAVAAILSAGIPLAGPGALPAAAATCKAGETSFKNGIFFTCVCATSGGRTTCRWQAD